MTGTRRRGGSNEKWKVAIDDSYLNPTNLKCQVQRHNYFKVEPQSNKKRFDEVIESGRELIESRHNQSDKIKARMQRRSPRSERTYPRTKKKESLKLSEALYNIHNTTEALKVVLCGWHVLLTEGPKLQTKAGRFIDGPAALQKRIGQGGMDLREGAHRHFNQLGQRLDRDPERHQKAPGDAGWDHQPWGQNCHLGVDRTAQVMVEDGHFPCDKTKSRLEQLHDRWDQLKEKVLLERPEASMEKNHPALIQ